MSSTPFFGRVPIFPFSAWARKNYSIIEKKEEEVRIIGFIGFGLLVLGLPFSILLLSWD